MFSNSQNMETISQLFRDAKEYGKLRLEKLELDTVSKLSRVVGMLVVGALLLAMLFLALIVLSLAAVYALDCVLNSMAWSMLIVGLLHLILTMLLYLGRKKLVYIPLTLLLYDILMPETTKTENEDEQ